MNVVRLPFRWERIQPRLGGELDAAEYRRLADTVHQATAKNLFVILDVHNYAAYRDKPIGSPDVPVAAFADLWKRLAGKFRKETQVGFGLMNEPKGLPTEAWLAAANAAIAQIRAAGANNLVFVPGNGWTGAHSWFGKSYGTPNAAVMLGVNDPGDNYVYELHQYLDSNYSGTHPECRSESAGATALTAVTDWLRQHRKRGFLGEFGAGSNPTCMAALDAMLGHIDQNRDVWRGWTYWAAGAWPARYFTSVQPVNGVDTPQMQVLLKHVGGAAQNRATR
jgi:endoglucanase